MATPLNESRNNDKSGISTIQGPEMGGEDGAPSRIKVELS